MKLHYINNSIENLQLPIVPKDFHIKSGKNSSSINLLGFGEINNSGTPTLKTWSISSIFPSKQYSVCTCTIKSNPYDYVSLIEKLKKENIVCTYVITKTNITFKCTIEEFEYWEEDGSGDIYFSINFKEHKEIKLATISDSSSTTSSTLYFKDDYTLDTTKTNKVIVKDGDTLINLAKAYYGDSSKYTDIMNKNGLSNPEDIKVGQVILL